MNSLDLLNAEHQTAEFSDEAKTIATLIASLLHHDEPNHIKVAIIKEALQTGQYSINAESIAHKLLEFTAMCTTGVTVNQVV